MPSGGPREGSGRKSGSKNKATLEIKTLLDECVDFKELIGKLVELSNGVEVEGMGIDGEPTVYVKAPDTHAAKILMEYRFGKPHQSISHSGEITEIIISKKIVK